MRKNILIGFGIAVALLVGFLAGRWSMRGPDAGPDGDELEPLRPVDEPHPEETRARVKYLIEMLASKNPAPKITGENNRKDGILTYPKEYKHALQVPVYLAMQQLLAE